MIQLLRVDHRLLHGQVVFSWCGQLNPNCILIANDAAATNDVRRLRCVWASPTMSSSSSRRWMIPLLPSTRARPTSTA